MKQITFTVTDPQGVHARPAGVLIKKSRNSSVQPRSPRTIRPLMRVRCLPFSVLVSSAARASR